jgi:hypothetical protein
MPRIDNGIIGAGGVFHVAAVFSMRGMIALPTIKNTAAYDIIVTSPDGLRHANFQVKTSSARPGYWPICQSISKVRTSPSDFYVLLRRTKDMTDFEAFMLSGSEMRTELEAYMEYYAAKGQRSDNFSLCASLGKEEKNNRWRETWKTWTLCTL